jgi:hypothetical protein
MRLGRGISERKKRVEQCRLFGKATSRKVREGGGNPSVIYASPVPCDSERASL